MRNNLLVALDARPLSHPQAGGFRTYVRALLTGIREQQSMGQSIPRLLLYIDRALTAEALACLPQGAETRLLSPSRLKTDWHLWNRQLRKDTPDIVFGTQNYLPLGLPIPSAIVLHDAMGIKSYTWDRHTPRNAKERLINRYWYYQTVASNRKARRILTVSQGSREEIRSVLSGIPETRFVVVYNGVTLPMPRYSGERDTNTLLCIASPDPRKNLALLYEALSKHRERFGTIALTLRIVCTSATTAARTESVLARYNLQAELLRGLDDQALSDAFARASVFVWPSYLEGFGMPPLEMMLTGGAVASSNAVCMPEVLGEAPVYFAPDSPEALADAVRTLLETPGLIRERGEQGRLRAASFTCQRMAQETIQVWEQAAGRNY